MKDKQWLLDEWEFIKAKYPYSLALNKILYKINQLEEPQKPVVPKFVADWFEENKRDLEYEIYNVISEISSKDTSEQSKIEQWFDANILNGKNHYPIEIAIRMQDGYTVEKESLYYAKIKGWEHTGTSSYFFGYDEENGSLEITYVDSNYRFAFLLTKEHWNKLGIDDSNADFEEAQ